MQDAPTDLFEAMQAPNAPAQSLHVRYAHPAMLSHTQDVLGALAETLHRHGADCGGRSRTPGADQ